MLDLRLDRWDALQRLVAALPTATPLEHFEITSDYGYRRDPINGRSAVHSGVDFAAPRNTPLYTTAPGVVSFAGWRGRYGRVVEIDHGFGIKTRYAHLAKISVKKGEELGIGVEVGLLGSSGRVTGPHLHYEVLFDGAPLDPMNFIKAGKNVL
jgi:murein DD-endopeptidase MepM/ murein hydrolase activator NlpD